MDDPLLVQMFDRPGHGGHEPNGGGGVDRALLDALGEISAVDILHREEVLAVDLADVVDMDDVRVPQPGGGLRLGLEPANRLGRSEMARPGSS